MIAIERLRPGDAARAEKVVRTFKSDSRAETALEAFLRNPANYLLVAEQEGEAIGFLLAYRLERADREASQMFVYEVEVAPAWRGRRLASALMEKIKDLARVEGMFEAFVFVYPMGLESGVRETALR